MLYEKSPVLAAKGVGRECPIGTVGRASPDSSSDECFLHFVHGECCSWKRIGKALIVVKAHIVDKIVAESLAVLERSNETIHNVLAHVVLLLYII